MLYFVKEVQSPLVKAFSLKQTTGKLLMEASADGDIECIHGIRALSTIALIVGHKVMAIAMVPYTNRGFLTEVYYCNKKNIIRKFCF